MANAAPFVASPLKRVVAGAIDTFLALVSAIVVIAAVTSLEEPSRFAMTLVIVTYAAVYTLYHVYFLWFLRGATPGQRVWRMCVVRASDGSGLSLGRAVVRSAFRPLFYFAYVWLILDLLDRLLPLPTVVYLVPVFIELGMMFTLPSRQTLADLVAKTLVVNVPPPQPHRAPAAPMYSPSDAEFGLPPRRR